MLKKITVINGPNLNLLGSRKPEVYGNTSLDEIVSSLRKRAAELGYTIAAVQTNAEGAYVNAVQSAADDSVGLIVNAAAYSHTSVAIRDALENLKIPVVEVHLSNIYAREDFRHHSYISAVASGVIAGFGPLSYYLALEALAEILKHS
ncbi:MAG TPA: type II 3-dehydroquinate dehydratase [Oligoflexia bacterium]|nr:type II 3-dehydroquinate dehydratase [Oligoflexia bacterium]